MDKNIHPENINQLIDEGMGDYPLYSAETSDIRRGEAESDIILARLNIRDNRPFPNRLIDLSDPNVRNRSYHT